MANCAKKIQQFTTPNLLSGYSAQLDPHIIAVLLPLFESEQPFSKLIEYYRKLYPFDPVTLEPISDQDIVNLLSGTLALLENYGYILLDPL
jgi:hypothetical protein